jgi:hypothetical protein
MTGKSTPVFTAVRRKGTAVPPLLFPTFTAVIQEQQDGVYRTENKREICRKIPT